MSHALLSDAPRRVVDGSSAEAPKRRRARRGGRPSHNRRESLELLKGTLGWKQAMLPGSGGPRFEIASLAWHGRELTGVTRPACRPHAKAWVQEGREASLRSDPLTCARGKRCKAFDSARGSRELVVSSEVQ